MALLPVEIGLGILAGILSGVLWYCIKGKSSGKPMVWFLLLFCCILGYLRMSYANRERPWEGYLEETRGRTVEIQGQIREIAEKEKVYGLTLSRCTMIWRTKTYEMSDLLVYVEKEEFERYEEQIIVRLGMRVSLRGKPEKPEAARNPGEFNFKKHYQSLGIYYQIFGEDFYVLDETYQSYQDGLYRLRLMAKGRLEQLCEPEDLGIFQAAILGDKSSLDENMQELYQRNGIAHLLAISGLHISLMGLGVYRILRKLGAGYGVAGGLGSWLIVSYGMLTGASASVVRAVAMVLVYMLAEYLGHCYDMLSAASLAGILLLLKSPYLILQVGFQLSFGAVFAIGGLVPWLSCRLKPRNRVAKSLLPGISIQLVTYPIILYHFFQYPIYGIFLNLMVIPLMQYVILSGVLGIFLGAVYPVAGRFALGSGHYVLKLYAWLCRALDNIPGSNLVIGRPEVWQIVLYYILLGGVLWWVYTNSSLGRQQIDERKKTDREKRWQMIKKAGRRERWGMMKGAGFLQWTGFGVGCCCCFFLLWRIPVRGLQVTCLDVGQGDGICIQTNQAVILVDGGSSSKKDLGKYSLEPYLKSRGISQIDYAIVSHGDTDHTSGLEYLLEENGAIQIKHLVLPWLGKEDSSYDRLTELMKEHGGDVHWMKSGEQIKSKKLLITCLYHGDEKTKSDINEHSLVLQLEYGQFEMLFTGDMGRNGELNLLESGHLGKGWGGKGETGTGESIDKTGKIRVLKVAHHGSKYSSCEEFLQEINPGYAIISYQEDNSYGHPHKEVLERLEKQNIRVWKTAESGAVTFYTKGAGAWVEEMISK